MYACDFGVSDGEGVGKARQKGRGGWITGL